MRGVRIPDDLNGEDRFLLGLSVTRLAVLLFGILAAYAILHLSLPAPLRFGAAAFAALSGVALAWVRPEGQSLIHWALAAIEFTFEQRAGQASAIRSGPESRPRLRVVAASTTALLKAASADPASSTAPPVEDDVIEIPASAIAEIDSEGEAVPAHPAPVYLGGPQVITFFSSKGGTGRTTLATEIGALLAMKGRYRESPAGAPGALRVVVVDFDRDSANVSARLGLAQPTMLDYLCDVTNPNPDPCDYVLRHPASNLDVLLGPSKCLAGDRADLLGVPQAAHILSTLKAAGYQFLILDLAASLGDLEIYLLEAATRIYCVVTPTAGSVQSLYRGVEALRRLGLGAKLHYVANKMRDGFNLSEPMSDLNGTLAARIPYDAAFDTAENRHEPMAIRGSGDSLEALQQLASSIYPALQLPARARSAFPFTWFGRRRHAG